MLFPFVVCRVFYRGILRTLVPVYQGIMDLLYEVVQCQPMAFLTHFTLPGDLGAFLGPPRSNLLNERITAETFGIRKTPKHSLLDRLFEEGSEQQVKQEMGEERPMMQMLASEEIVSNMDLGSSVLRHGPSCSRKSGFFINFFFFLTVNINIGFLFHTSVGLSSLDIKAILQQATKQVSKHFREFQSELKHIDCRSV